MINIKIETIPHHEHRYDTVGDWTHDALGNLTIRVSDLGNWRYELLVALHEFVEAMLCSHAGISQKVVDLFDLNYKGGYAEPGDDPKAPYSGPHCLATGVERVVAAVMGISWSKYEDTLEDLPKWKDRNGPTE